MAVAEWRAHAGGSTVASFYYHGSSIERLRYLVSHSNCRFQVRAKPRCATSCAPFVRTSPPATRSSSREAGSSAAFPEPPLPASGARREAAAAPAGTCGGKKGLPRARSSFPAAAAMPHSEKPHDRTHVPRVDRPAPGGRRGGALALRSSVRSTLGMRAAAGIDLLGFGL